jgi:hypothetical protein
MLLFLRVEREVKAAGPAGRDAVFATRACGPGKALRCLA